MGHHHRHISNNFSWQTLQAPIPNLLQASLEGIIQLTPPKSSYQEQHLGGLYSGYTGLAYLFFRISAIHHDLKILGQEPLVWAKQYLKGQRDNLAIQPGNCGVSCEKLSYEAVRACVTRDPKDVLEFALSIPKLIGPYAGPDPYPSDLVKGRAGALYLVRMVRHWVPELSTCLSSPMDRLIAKILESAEEGGGTWRWQGRGYLGAAHGDIGIITQLVLSRPEIARRFAGRLEDLLDSQTNGNWLPSEQNDKEDQTQLVQFCHGAPGFVYSLRALRPHFPAIRPNHPHIRQKIDLAITNAQELIWRRGLLTKEPTLCHGIFGNALALPQGRRREHFLTLATPQVVNKVKQHDPELFELASCGKAVGVMASYVHSAAWAWAVCDEEYPGMLMYTDL